MSMIKIGINGRPFLVNEGRSMTYAELLKASGIQGQPRITVSYLLTEDQDKEDDVLEDGEAVVAVENMNITVE